MRLGGIWTRGINWVRRRQKKAGTVRPASGILGGNQPRQVKPGKTVVRKSAEPGKGKNFDIEA